MASSTSQVSVGVKLDLINRAQTMKDLSKSLQETFTVDTSTTFGKSLHKTIASLEGEFLKIDTLTGKEFFSEKDMNATVSSLERAATIFSKIEVMTKGASIGSLGLDDDEKLVAINKRIQELRDNIKSLKGMSIASLWGENDPKMAQFGKDAKKTGFNAGKDYDSNIKTMERKQGALSAEYAAMKEQAEDATDALNRLNEAQNKIASFTPEQLKEGAAVDDRIAINQRVATAVKGAGWIGGRKGRTAEEVRMAQGAALRDNILNDVGTGYREDGKEFAKVVASWLNLDDASVTNNARETWDRLYTAFEKEAEKAQDGKPGAHNFGVGALYNKAKETLKGNYAADRHITAEALEARNAQNELSASQLAWNEIPVESQQAAKNLLETEALLERLAAQMEILRAKRDEYYNTIANEQGLELVQAEQEKAVRTAELKAEQLKPVTEAKQAAGTIAAGAGRTADEHYLQKALAAEQENQRKQEEKETADFNAKLKSSISHWMNASQVISMIKQGISQAYQDIKNLDQAMANIAVVTDMSVSDLWGQINEYMSIAQKYGVTTQGVYEVSQLFYQQGLGSSDVISATTETLKMARQ